MNSFMHKEIHEQPQVLARILSEKVKNGRVILDLGVEKYRGIERIIMIACGTSLHSCYSGKLFMENHANIPVEVDIASEFYCRNLILNDKVLCIFLSQSGETSDTLKALYSAKEKGAKTLAICNVEGSTLSKDADDVIYLNAGEELSIASTKAFTAQVMHLMLLSLWMGQIRQVLTDKSDILIRELLNIPENMSLILKAEKEIAEIANNFYQSKHMFVLGHGNNYPVAYEGALKVKETTYIHAEAYPSSEFRHGPIALVDEGFPLVVIATKCRFSQDVFAVIESVIDKSPLIFGIFSESSKDEHPKCSCTFYIKDNHEELAVFFTSLVLQLFAYNCACLLGRNVDNPRYLTKSVI